MWDEREIWKIRNYVGWEKILENWIGVTRVRIIWDEKKICKHVLGVTLGGMREKFGERDRSN